jgi:uncharacterized membrane protein
MDKKTLALISYITIIGWLISYFLSKEKEKDSFVTYHQKQSLGLFIVWLVYSVVVYIISFILALISLKLLLIASLLYYVSLLFLVLMIIGILNAVNNVKKPLPLIGSYFENKFGFI